MLQNRSESALVDMIRIFRLLMEFSFVIVMPNSVYHRSKDRLYSRRISSLSKYETTEYRSLWRCCQPPRLIYPLPPHSQEPTGSVRSSHSAKCRVSSNENMLPNPCQCIADQQICSWCLNMPICQ